MKIRLKVVADRPLQKCSMLPVFECGLFLLFACLFPSFLFWLCLQLVFCGRLAVRLPRFNGVAMPSSGYRALFASQSDII